jgi:hypothetical protein
MLFNVGLPVVAQRLLKNTEHRWYRAQVNIPFQMSRFLAYKSRNRERAHAAATRVAQDILNARRPLLFNPGKRDSCDSVHNVKLREGSGVGILSMSR